MRKPVAVLSFLLLAFGALVFGACKAKEPAPVPTPQVTEEAAQPAVAEPAAGEEAPTAGEEEADLPPPEQEQEEVQPPPLK